MLSFRDDGHAVVTELALAPDRARRLVRTLLIGLALAAVPLAHVGWEAATAEAREAALEAAFVDVRDPPIDPRLLRSLGAGTFDAELLEIEARRALLTETLADASYRPIPADEAIACLARAAEPGGCPEEDLVRAIASLKAVDAWTAEQTQALAERSLVAHLEGDGFTAEAAALRRAIEQGQRFNERSAPLIIERRMGIVPGSRRVQVEPAPIPGDGWVPWLGGLLGLSVSAGVAYALGLARGRQRIEVHGWGLAIDGERVPAATLRSCRAIDRELALVTEAGLRVLGPFDATPDEVAALADAVAKVVPTAADLRAEEVARREVLAADARLRQELRAREP